MRSHPHAYEANALIFLKRASKRHGRDLALSQIPDEEWQRLSKMGFDYIWLMGVWRRSPGARRAALEGEGLRGEYSAALPDWNQDDVVGSPFAVYDYSLDPSLGGPDDLRALKAKLNGLGLRLMLDFVPNHVALDHPWTLSHPDWFVQADEKTLESRPGWFFSPDGKTYLAHGKDPYFPPWTDTAQLNYSSAEMREALIEELMKIADVSDGVRCDMAMLPLNSVFQPIWSWALEEASMPASEFWPDAIGAVRKRHPGFLFLAEVYWGLERELQQMGFDSTYDKVLYDRLRHSSAADVRGQLMAMKPFHSRLARFIENHDEARAMAAFGPGRARAAAVILATSPGLRLFHDGQLDGKQTRLPVQLGREPEEAPDAATQRFYQRLLSICDSPAFHEGEWTPLDSLAAWEGNTSNQSILTWAWLKGGEIKVVAVNYSSSTAQSRLHIPLPPAIGGGILLQDMLAGVTYNRDYSELKKAGLYIALDPWGAHVFDVRKD